MIFDLYVPFRSKKQDRWCPGVQAQPLDADRLQQIAKDAFTRTLVEEYQGGDKEAKTKLPAVCWTGKARNGKRKAEEMEPTQFFMVDIDHIEDIESALSDVTRQFLLMGEDQLALMHITPSGKGMRFIVRATQDFPTLKEHMEWFVEKYKLDQYGDFDGAVKDLSRLSFLVPFDYFKYMNFDLLFGSDENEHKPIKALAEAPVEAPKEQEATIQGEETEPAEYEEYRKAEYKGALVTRIVAKYIEVYGEPSQGEKHNFYNQMVKYFRCITDNNPKVVHAVLPRFGHSFAETLSQCQSICRTNTLSRLPKEFYFFLKDNGFFTPRPTASAQEQQAIQMSEEEEVETNPMPKLPPVFREFCKICPTDFIKPTINALLPIMGTLTSYLRSEYPLDGREHSTSFFSIVYAPPASGKGYANRLQILLEGIKTRDLLNNERENLYNKLVSKKGANEKSPNDPHVTVRIFPAINSQAELLTKMRDNQGYHMFTFVEELDTWAKGARAGGGGDKSDLIRVAWDNGEYGQSFRSGNTFKGIVNLYWNVLITGTPGQLDKYFADVENGLVTRCGFCEIPNQRFAKAQVWKSLTKADMRVIQAFMDRCDENTYKEPLDFDASILYDVQDENFDNEVPWKYTYKPFVNVDMTWLMPTINAFLDEELKRSILDQDEARDTFRRRAAVRGFRLGLLCTALWTKVGEKEKKVIKDFVKWWMVEDLAGILKLYGDKFNEVQQRGTQKLPQKGLFEMLDEKFTKSDLYVACQKLGIRTKLRRIIFDWKKVKAIEYVPDEKDTFIKVNKKNGKDKNNK